MFPNVYQDDKQCREGLQLDEVDTLKGLKSLLAAEGMELQLIEEAVANDKVDQVGGTKSDESSKTDDDTFN